MTEVVVTTSRGAVRGVREHGVSRYLGIPYAAAPSGPARFAAPVPAPWWGGVREATEPGPTAPGHPLGGLDFLPDPRTPGEQYLNVNIWTGAVPGSAERRPVLVWLHGGANVTGSANQPIFAGATFAAHGIVVVAVNHRLGAEGFARLPDAPDNRALLDQRLALEWVQEEIAAFGGDPGRVTLAGTSAGAGNVLAHLSRPTGLFRRAIVQSAAPQAALSTVDADRVAKELADRAGVPPTAAGLAQVAPDELAALSTDLTRDVLTDPDPLRWGETTVTASLAFGPTLDGTLLPRHPYDALLAGAGRDVDLLIGTNTDELLMLVPDHRLAAELTESTFREPVYRIAESRAGAAATYVYEFGWRSPLDGVGAAHGLELGFVFNNLGVSGLEGLAPPQDLATTVHGAWVSFVAYGDAGWHAFTEDVPFVRRLG
ncbi:carboxylesterase/lipase family protein [Crossiella equi]|nr:carboxylesterase family protein [Crossiella equi]